MSTERLHVITARYNPMRWKATERHFHEWVQHMLDSGVVLTVCELQYGDRPFICELPHVNHVGVRSDSWCWNKENLLNLALQTLPEAKYIAWPDSDIFHRNQDWSTQTIDALRELYVVQTWTQCIDLGPDGEICDIHRSLGDLYQRKMPITKDEDRPWWTREGGIHEYAHPGFSWACRRELLERTGGFLDRALFGSGDFHMALGVLGIAERSLASGLGAAYRQMVLAWQAQAAPLVSGRLGAVRGTIEHRFHGRRRERGHGSRWDMVTRHDFDPVADVRRNRDGVLEWAGNKPALELDWERYLRSRNEDVNWL